MATDQKAYRRYHATIERALTLFDVNSDWADYIAFLSRLLKSLETAKPDGLTDVPCKAKIALCLSRSLQPHLPSGVHQKALDVYNEVFSTIGQLGLARDLSLYLPGLSHTLGFANLATRPLVLNLFEEFVLKLSPTSLRSALKALILSLLPIIEETSSEDFERCLRTFNFLRVAFAAENQEFFFWQNLFVASISSPLRRTGVLVYLNQYLPKLTSIEARNGSGLVKTISDDQSGPNVIVKPEPGLLVRCFATGLRDEQALVQRGFLDLLVTHLPLNAAILQEEVYSKDLDVLVTAAMMIVLRRDMGLNRRLWAWCTGSDGKVEVQVTSPMEDANKQIEDRSEYFRQFGVQATTRSIQSLLIEQSPDPGPRTLPFRIALSLMDRWEIGGPVMKASLAPMMRSLLNYQSSAPTQDAFDEVFRSASAFFDGIESAVLFDCLSTLLQSGEVELVAFIVANFNLEQIDMARGYICRFGSTVATSCLNESDSKHALLALLSDVMATVPPLTTQLSSQELDAASELLKNVSKILTAAFATHEDSLLLSDACTCFEQAIGLGGSLDSVFEGFSIESMKSAMTDRKAGVSSTFSSLDVCVRILEGLLRRHRDLNLNAIQTCLDRLPDLVKGLWFFLGASTPQFHVSVVEHIWRLHDSALEYEVVESTLLEQITHESDISTPSTSDQIERFGVLFHHTKTIKRNFEDSVPHMLRVASLRILDSTNGEERGEPGVQWLMSLQSISPIIRAVLDAQLDDPQVMVLALYRIQKLVRIVNLSEDHWRSFSSSPELPIIRDFCVSLVQNEGKQLRQLTHDAFILLRTLYGDRSGNTPSEEFVLLLVDMLAATTNNSVVQEEVLDTLLAILNDKSMLPSSLVNVLLEGLATVPIDDRLDKWITLLCNFLPNHAALLPSLLKTTGSFCKRLEQAFEDLQSVFNHRKENTSSKNPERSIVNLLSGLEYVLARAHQQVLQGVITNGVPSESVSIRSRANDRLTVVLCMQDAVRMCTRLWSWKALPRPEGLTHPRPATGDVKSFQYSAIKLRSRSRKILENLIEAEPQECLETLIGMWSAREQNSVLDLLQTLNGARPRLMMPAVFNAIYSRANPGVLNASQKSSLSIQTNPIELALFLNEYTSALEDDMLEEIWTDCATFLREVLGNPMPHRLILIKLLHFCSLLSRKMENTKFAEGLRMHRELADICARLFTAIFTIKPSGFDGSGVIDESSSKTIKSTMSKDETLKPDNMLVTLVEILPNLSSLMGQSDRMTAIHAAISTNITSPSLHARTFPNNITAEHLEVMRLMASSSGNLKIWRRDIVDSFGNPRFFQTSLSLAEKCWLPLIKQLQVNDKMIITECLGHIPPPAAAGIMFGVGATTARNETDKKTQLELRRIATLVLSCELDGSLSQLPQLLQKIEELFSATPESSPSLAIRGEVYLLIRVLLLKISHPNLTPLWPILDRELQDLCKDILAGSESKHGAASKIQGIKILDLLLLMRPDEFQLHEWLFVTDTIDAIYPSASVPATSFADEIAPMLSENTNHIDAPPHALNKLRRPWLYQRMPVAALDVDTVLAGFFSQLSIRAFEDLYSLQPLDEEACVRDVLGDVFSEIAV